jgi:DNA-binding transcriptional LysR family regulator
MMNMRWKQLRQADLNLLVAFMVFAEERSISAAAKRLLLSQPAATRTLQRLRALFGDDLMIRGSGGYQLTPAGARLQEELNTLLPQLDSLLGQPSFDPATEQASFRLSGPDNVCGVLCPLLCREVLRRAPRVELIFVPWSETRINDLDRGRLALAFSNDDVLLPMHLRALPLYEERWYCVTWSGSRLPKRVTLRRYLEAEHIAVSVLDAVQTIPDKRISALGKQRRTAITLPYFGAAMECLPHTELVLTATSSVARIARKNPALRVVPAPPELTPFTFQAVWHPRLNSEPAHLWLRSELQRVCQGLEISLALS